MSILWKPLGSMLLFIILNIHISVYYQVNLTAKIFSIILNFKIFSKKYVFINLLKCGVIINDYNISN